MGAGKSAVGSRLAARMETDFVDLDSIIEVEADLPVAEIFAREGEDGFRRLEHSVLRGVCSAERDRVVATGGGTPASRENRDLMRTSGMTLWLDPPLELILSRLGDKSRSRRPLFESPARARELFRQRRAAYAAADLRVEPVEGDSADQTVQRVIDCLKEHPVGSQLVGGRESSER